MFGSPWAGRKRLQLGPWRVRRAGLLGPPLHRELVWILDSLAEAPFSKKYAELDGPAKASLRERLKEEIGRNYYNPETGDVTISDRSSGVD
jgi:hypothetical protein